MAYINHDIDDAVRAGVIAAKDLPAQPLDILGPTGPRRIKGLLSPTTTVAHKTGTSGTVNGLTRATNDVGLITLPDGKHLAVAVFVADSKANQAIRERVIAKIARAAWDWGQ